METFKVSVIQISAATVILRTSALLIVIPFTTSPPAVDALQLNL